MPTPPGTRFRVKTTEGGKKIRLAFKNNKVIEAKKLNNPGSPRNFRDFVRKRKTKTTANRRGQLTAIENRVNLPNRTVPRLKTV